MNIPPKYQPETIEDKWYVVWLKENLFSSKPDARESYTVVIPPPNVTGVLHMGHMLNNTIQDVLVRRARMQGKNACWVPGTDHASIATEAKVVAKLKEQGIEKTDLTREEFLKYAWEWKEKHGGIILEQLKKLGASCDWERTRFTMEPDLYESVIDVFVDLYNKGLIYRGVRMVNWDPQALTALSDEEVIYKESHSKLYYLKYRVENSDEFITVATTRPETILGDTAVCVHPQDPRYQNLKGKKVIVPVVGRVVPVIYDDYVDMEFGTGALKITPAHDINDYNIGIAHKLDSIDIFNDNGTLNRFGGVYEGMDRFRCRKQIVQDLEEAGLLLKTEDYVNNVGYSERTNAVIEPKLSQQWFLNMEKLSKPALDVVMNDVVKFHPAKFKNTYRHWMENIKDWCISRQLWWGQRIPAYYLPNKEYVVAKTKEEAFVLAQERYGKDCCTMEQMQQDPDVLDTWFSSWLWPISVFDGIRHPNNEDIKYYYPTQDLITAPEIMFFWVARMIMAGLEYRGEVPFHNVYFTGIVRDKLGRKMSKSLGNSPDPIKLMEQYGADGVRLGMLLASPAGNDLPFDESYCEQGRNFANKIWNALRLVQGWDIDDRLSQPSVNALAVRWFNQEWNARLKEIESDFDQYRLSEALMEVYKLIWDEFCSWFLELIKPAYQQPIDCQTYKETVSIFEDLMKLLHPFMPFLTEEIWHLLDPNRSHKDSIMVAPMPKSQPTEEKVLQDFNLVKEIIVSVRQVRNEKNIPPKELLKLFVIPNEQNKKTVETYEELIRKMAFLESLESVEDKVEEAVSMVIHGVEIFIPIPARLVNVEEETARIEKELDHAKSFLQSVEKKLANERFVCGAPENIVALERKKKHDAEEKIAILTARLDTLKK